MTTARNRPGFFLAALTTTLLVGTGCASLLDYDSIEFDEGASGAAGLGASAGHGGSAATGATGGSGAQGGNGAQGGSGAQGGAGAGGSGAQGGAGAGGSGAQGGTGAGGSGAQGGAGAGGSGAQGGAGAGGSGAQGGAGPLDPCASGVTCDSTKYCDPVDSQCKCLPGWTANGANCEPNLPGDPAGHSQQAACDMWNWGHQVDDPAPWTSGANQCDPGTTSRDGLNDTVRRLNAFRWLVGLGPSADSPTANETNRWCAVVASWNPPGTVPDAHHPPPSAKCFTTTGLSGTSSSNLAWGPRHPANAIDQFVQDNGVSSLGHRRWIFNPPLGPVGIGYYAGGGQYGDAQCLGVFASSGGGPSPDWVAWPPPGYAPASVYAWTWSFHHKSSLSNASVSVVRDSDGADMPVSLNQLGTGYGSYYTLGITKSWSVTAGQSFTVTISGLSAGPISYQLFPVNC